ncbi:DUF4199 family protein [Flaviaesturariibacter flavus]|uniref:DUF4199 family protein n=1 Tax=Flaviaesturariibacter flavus TaxID=2502780 RepID=A0A4R1BPN1_9BACT|nr:DUF4199 family protein [Flaviaesturariibacter flavus]TCJ19287.1 DUF4199 family protein [Flaviaesturariibacter flavus]
MEATKKNAHLRPALLIAVVMLGIHTWIHTRGLGLNPSMLLAATLPMVIGIFYNTWQHARVTPGSTFGTNFAYGFRIASVITVIMVLFVVIFFKAFPGYKDHLVEALQRSVDRRSSGMDDEAVSKAIQDWDQHFTQRIVTIYIFLHLVTGAVAAALAALVSTRKTKTD